jgi:anti-sigma factor RsiW
VNPACGCACLTGRGTVFHETEGERVTCRGVIGLLGDYLESLLSQALVDELEEHLARCEPCQAYLNTYRRTKTLTAETERVAMPDEMKQRLREFLVRVLSSDR